MKKILCLLGVAVVSLAGLTSCEEYVTVPSALPAEAQGVPVTVSIGFADETDTPVQTPETRGEAGAFTVQQGTARTRDVATDAPKPDALYFLEVQQYTAAGALLQNNIMSESSQTAITPGSNLTLTLTPTSDTDYCQLLIVARGSGQAMPTLKGKTLSAVQSDVSVTSSVINGIDNTADGIKSMPYVLHLEKVKVVQVDGKYVIQSPDGAYDVRLLLKRLATRLTVNWKYNVPDYELKQLLIQSVPLNYAVVDKPDADGTYPSLVSQFTTLVTPITDRNAGEGSYSCWIPANVRGESVTATSDIQRTKANSPTGSVFFNFVAGNTKDPKKKLDYRVYIGSGASTDFNVYRNKNYVYTVNFNHAGIPTADGRVTYIDPIPASENNDNLLPTANCFMIAPGSAFCFDPFVFQQNGKEITNTVMTGWYTAGTGIKSVKLHWQTKENGDVGEPVMGIANADDDQTNIVDIKRTDGSNIGISPANDKGQCLIYCRVASNTSGGNGLIAAYDGPNGTGNIVWSWHVWVTDYHPDASGNEDVQYPVEKRKQKYVGNNAPDQYPMMDRNLGALCGYTVAPSLPLDQSKANGFHYQQGRKDPFPSSFSAVASSEIKDIYSSSPPKGMLNLYESDGVTYKPRERKVISTLQEAYQHPIRMYESGALSSSQGAAWEGSLKTLHDPCPAGWRVPTKSNYRALFVGEYLTSGNVKKFTPRLADGFLWDDGKIYGGYLVVYNEKSNTTYFRMTGFGNNTTSFVIVGQAGNIWVRDKLYTFDFGFNANATHKPAYEVSYGWVPADAHNVRCIQEGE